MQAPEDAHGGAKGGQRDKGTLGGPGGPDPTEGGEGAGADGAAALERAEDQGTGQEPLPGGGASASAGNSTGEVREVRLTFPFRNALEAEFACLHLTLAPEPMVPGVQREVTVSGTDLNILMTAKDPYLLDVSIACMLNQLSMVFPFLGNFEN